MRDLHDGGNGDRDRVEERRRHRHAQDPFAQEHQRHEQADRDRFARDPDRGAWRDGEHHDDGQQRRNADEERRRLLKALCEEHAIGDRRQRDGADDGREADARA